MSIILAIDAMGGDNAPDIVISGASLALVSNPLLQFHFFGDQSRIAPLLQKYPDLLNCSVVHHTDQYIPSDMKPSLALRQSKSSSMRMALESTRDGLTAATISAGNTGAYMVLAKMVLKTLPDVTRPAIGGMLPTADGRGCVMLDLGANVDVSAQGLVQYAIMGHFFAQAVLKLANPRVGLLNIGSEDTKGSPAIQEAHKVLRNFSQLNYCGFIEGNQILAGAMDVIVADGFAGNVALKTAEGTSAYIKANLHEAFGKNIFTKLAYLLCRPVLKALSAKLDHRCFNGGPFLGLNGIAVKSHGGADAVSFAAAIKVACEMVSLKINDKISNEMQALAQNSTEVESTTAAEGIVSVCQ